MKIFCLALLLSLAGCCMPRAAQQMATVRLDITDGTCSGTVVAPDVILSAGHCFEDEDDEDADEAPPTSVLVDGYKVKILAVVFDGNDHALVKVDFTFPHYVALAQAPAVGTHVHYWGNPGGINNVYREGYVTSYEHGSMMLDVNGFFGDSGAGIFDADGNVVGVISSINVSRHHGLVFTLMGAKALEFTPLQYELMGL